mmetsp:Transcript_1016/g.3115  ORF Transcript_1016/g.3115 Transcript_1016/m.3115 type:complete len:218 (-) Transcript_1016:1603-2256(-)
MRSRPHLNHASNLDELHAADTQMQKGLARIELRRVQARLGRNALAELCHEVFVRHGADAGWVSRRGSLSSPRTGRLSARCGLSASSPIRGREGVEDGEGCLRGAEEVLARAAARDLARLGFENRALLDDHHCVQGDRVRRRHGGQDGLRHLPGLASVLRAHLGHAHEDLGAALVARSACGALGRVARLAALGRRRFPSGHSKDRERARPDFRRPLLR